MRKVVRIRKAVRINSPRKAAAQPPIEVKKLVRKAVRIKVPRKEEAMQPPIEVKKLLPVDPPTEKITFVDPPTEKIVARPKKSRRKKKITLVDQKIVARPRKPLRKKIQYCQQPHGCVGDKKLTAEEADAPAHCRICQVIMCDTCAAGADNIPAIEQYPLEKRKRLVPQPTGTVSGFLCSEHLNEDWL